MHTTEDDYAEIKAWLNSLINKRVTQRSHVSFIQFQPEKCPTTGKIHFQLYAQFSNAVKFEKAKALFEFNGKQFHVEQCKGSSVDNEAYTSKDDTRVEGATTTRLGEVRHLKSCVTQGARTDLTEFKEAVDAKMSWDDLIDNYFETIAHFYTFARKYFDMVSENKQLGDIKTALQATNLRGWQHGVVNLVKLPPSDRTVHWFWENEGNIGKSYMSRYLSVMNDAIIVQAMKKSDMIYLITKNIRKTNVVIFDLCRSSEQGSVSVVYEVVEMLKNGYLCSGKYDSQSFSFSVPHVICFANFQPDRSCLSADRWNEVHLTGINLVYETVFNN